MKKTKQTLPSKWLIALIPSVEEMHLLSGFQVCFCHEVASPKLLDNPRKMVA